MAENSKISWTDHTFNPWIGCASVSPGCKFCYAEAFAGRYLKVKWGNNPRHITAASTWKKPLQWQKMAEKNKTRYRVFCASLADVFEDNAELIQVRQDLWKLIQATPNLDWLLLTKRPENYELLFPPDWRRMGFFPRNIWLGVTVCNQKEYDTNWAILKRFQYAYDVPVSFISFEPLLGRITLDNGAPDWSIIGGESGFLKDARPMELEWVQHLIRYIRALNDSSKHIFFKQFGSQLAKKLKLKDMKGENWEGQLSKMYDWLTVREVPHYNENKPIENQQPTIFP